MKNDSLVSVYKPLDFAQTRAKCGEAQYTLLAENVKRLSSNELGQVKYHTENVIREKRFRDLSCRELLQVTCMEHVCQILTL